MGIGFISTTKTNKTAKKRSRKQQQQPVPVMNEVNFPVVGIGASAGGLQAISELLKCLPVDTGMAFVVIQHLSPQHESMLTELLSRETEMHVSEIRDGMMIKPNQVYVIPPNSNLGILHGTLNLIPREKSVGQYLPIDFFLRSLAREQSNLAVGVILSGSASDGVMGLMEIKAAGGITFAQDQDTAVYGSMPHSAVASGCVDFVKSPDGIAEELIRIGKHPYVKIKDIKPEQTTTDDENSLRKIFLLLRQNTGNDFTYYKQSTVLRRLKRRILLHKLESIKDYAQYLYESPEEVYELSRDLLINVTSFFRDPDVFEDLKRIVFPNISKNKKVGQPIRIWVPGCSTGEEAYSIAICLIEFLGDMAANTRIQLFATDLDEQAINKARAGIYTTSIEDVVSKNRLNRFFTRVDEGYEIAKHIREICVFAQQNVYKDPPFSRLDFISCRNLLIYLSPILQQKIMPVFHYALNYPGYLLLGTSETVGRSVDLFKLIKKKNRLYEKKLGPVQLRTNFGSIPIIEMRNESPGEKETMNTSVWSNQDIQREADRIVLKKYAPCGVVINEELDVLQFRGHTGDYLEPAAGEANLNLLKMARNGLHIELRNIIHHAIKDNLGIHKEGVRLARDGEISFVDVDIEPIKENSSDTKHFLVLFHQRKKNSVSESNWQVEQDNKAVVPDVTFSMKFPYTF